MGFSFLSTNDKQQAFASYSHGLGYIPPSADLASLAAEQPSNAQSGYRAAYC